MDKKYFFSVLVICAGFIFDRITKMFFLDGKNNADFGFFAFNFVKNTGASFGILKSMNILLIIISAAAIIALVYFRKEVPLVPFSFIICGALGNLIDRIFLGYVVDFFDFKFFPVFNIADSLITIGVVVWLLGIVLKKKPQNSSISSSLSK